MSSEEDPPYRRRAPAVPAALRELADQAEGKRLELPKQARDLAASDRADRLELTTDSPNAYGCGTIMLGLVGAVLVFSGFANAWVLIPGLVIGGGAVLLYHLGDRDAAIKRKAVLAEHATRPYPLRDYPLWLASDRPLLDVVLKAPADPRVVVDAVQALDPEIDVEWLSDTRVRLAIPPVRLRAVSKNTSELWGGDRKRLAEILDKIVDPLHVEVGVDHVDLGGTMTRLPEPAA